MKHYKKNPGSGLHAPATRCMINQQAPPETPNRVKPAAVADSEKHPAEDPRLRSYYQNENQARFNRSAQQRPNMGNAVERKVQRGPNAAYEVNKLMPFDNEKPLDDNASALDRIRRERSRLLDDE